jgi:hypothetical protein
MRRTRIRETKAKETIYFSSAFIFLFLLLPACFLNERMREKRASSASFSLHHHPCLFSLLRYFAFLFFSIIMILITCSYDSSCQEKREKKEDSFHSGLSANSLPCLSITTA